MGFLTASSSGPGRKGLATHRWRTCGDAAASHQLLMLIITIRVRPCAQQNIVRACIHTSIGSSQTAQVLRSKGAHLCRKKLRTNRCQRQA